MRPTGDIRNSREGGHNRQDGEDGSRGLALARGSGWSAARDGHMAVLISDRANWMFPLLALIRPICSWVVWFVWESVISLPHTNQSLPASGAHTIALVGEAKGAWHATRRLLLQLAILAC
jgi:hypothetical protein